MDRIEMMREFSQIKSGSCQDNIKLWVEYKIIFVSIMENIIRQMSQLDIRILQI